MIQLTVDGVGKVYGPRRAPLRRMFDLLFGHANTAVSNAPSALTDVTFQVEAGEVLGILGRNGSGKSTLLQILSGILPATSGTVEVTGRIAALLELGAGFNPDFTGRENVFLNAAILGLSRTQTVERLPDILAFADIGEYIDRPVKQYSSGMFVRLAFAVATAVDPDVLIIDEALAVGDVQFQSKCFRRFDQLKKAGKTILLVTHATEHVVRHCTRAILIDKGRLISQGDPRDIANQYIDLVLGGGGAPPAPTGPTEEVAALERESVQAHIGDQTLVEDRPGYCRSEYRWGGGGGRVLDIRLSRPGESPHCLVFRPGEPFCLYVRVKFESVVREPVIGFFVKTPDGVTVYGTNTFNTNTDLADVGVTPGAECLVRFECTMHLGAGPYLLSVGLAQRREGEVVPIDRRYDVLQFEVHDDSGAVGLAALHAMATVLGNPDASR